MKLFFIIFKYLFLYILDKKCLFANLNCGNAFPLLHFPLYAVLNLFYIRSSFIILSITLYFFLKPNQKHWAYLYQRISYLSFRNFFFFFFHYVYFFINSDFPIYFIHVWFFSSNTLIVSIFFVCLTNNLFIIFSHYRTVSTIIIGHTNVDFSIFSLCFFYLFFLFECLWIFFFKSTRFYYSYFLIIMKLFIFLHTKCKHLEHFLKLHSKIVIQEVSEYFYNIYIFITQWH